MKYTKISTIREFPAIRYLKIFLQGRIDTQSSHKTAQCAAKGKLSDDCTGALGEGPDGVAIGGQLLLSLLVGWILRQITAYNIAQLGLGHLQATREKWIAKRVYFF